MYLLFIIVLSSHFKTVIGIGCETWEQKLHDPVDLKLVEDETVDPPADTRLVKKYKQTWHNIDVYGHGVTIDARSGDVIMSKVAECIWIDLNTTEPAISMNEAAEMVFQQLMKHPSDTYDIVTDDRNSKEYVYVDPLTNKAALIYYLVIHIGYQQEMTSSNVFAFVNSITSEVISIQQYTESYLMQGDGGNAKVGRYRYGEGQYAERLLEVEGCKGCTKCSAKNPYVEVYNANHTQYRIYPHYCFLANPVYEEPCDPPSPNKDSTQTAYSNVHDALYHTTAFREMLQKEFKDKTLNKCSPSGAIKICVHYNSTLMPMFRDIGNCETYYGQPSDHFLDQVSPVIVGHELGHALIKVNSQLDYRCQSGGIAESFSDICGVTYRAFLNPDMPVDWRVGDDVRTWDNFQTAIRYLNDPPADGVSIDCTRDFKHDTCLQSSPETDPHSVAGIFNKGFYNLATTDGWDIFQAFYVFVRANRFYWLSSVIFDTALCGLIESTIDLYGKQGQDIAQQKAKDISNAFAKVGVFCSVVEKPRYEYASDRLGESTKDLILSHEIGCGPNWITKQFKTDILGNDINICYHISDEYATWAAAYQSCQSMGGYLAVVDIAEKAQLVYSIIPGVEEYWVGATDLKVEGSWRWTYWDIPVDWTDWRDNQPSSGSAQNCMAAEHQQMYGWNDEICSEKKRYVCEKHCCGNKCRRAQA